MRNLLYEVNDVLPILNDPNFIIIDCRFDLSDEHWGYLDYLKGHIPGAFYADLNKNLSSQPTISSGRHPLPDQVEFITFLSELGITNDRTVLLYDTSFGSFAVRLWWLLRSYGHLRTFLINGGFQAWVAKDNPIETNIPKKKPALFKGNFIGQYLIDQKEIEKILNDQNYLLIDARSPLRYQGIEEPIDKIAGRIPGAINIFHQDHLDKNGFLLPEKELRAMYSFLKDFKKEENIILYCGSGVTSCFNLFVLSQIGMDKPRLYAGSWSEWIQDPNHPIIKNKR